MSFWGNLFGNNADRMLEAITQRDTGKLVQLLDKGIDPNLVLEAHGGSTILEFAVSAESSECVEMLVERGADPNQPGRDGVTPLWRALFSGIDDNLEVIHTIRRLLERGADPNRPGSEGLPPLLFLTSLVEERGGIVTALLDHGAEIDGRNDTGITPLMAAALRGQSHVVKLLLERGANADLHEQEGRSALQLCEEADRADRGERKFFPVIGAIDRAECIALLKEASLSENRKLNSPVQKETGSLPYDASYEPDSCTPAAAFGRAFISSISDHVGRMANSPQIDEVALRCVFNEPNLTTLAELAGAKMALTVQDGQIHSVMFDHDKTAIVVITQTGTIESVATDYRNGRGYTNELSRYLASEFVRNLEPDRFCHILFGYDGQKVWVNVSIVAISEQAFPQTPILAIDLMSESEIAQLGDRLKTEL